MNQQINKYLQLMDFYINFSLDEEFKESIKSPVHEDFSYESFSEGEKMRIDLSLLFTWRDIAKMKNSVSTNLLILDEIFDSSLDGFGTDYFTRIIKYVVTDANVFVISHKTDELVDKFDNILKFDKIKGFSKLTTVNLPLRTMKVPNWQHHSKKEQKRHLKPQALRQARKRRNHLKKCLLNPPKRRVLEYHGGIR